MLYFFFGAESFLIKERVNKAKKEFIANNPEAAVADFSVEEDSLSKIKESLSVGGGLFSMKKMVLIRDVFQLNKEEQEALANILKTFISKKDLQVVAVNSGKIPGKNKLTEFLKKADQVEEFSFLKSNEVKDWIKQKTQEKSGGRLEISAGAVNYLEFNYGKDLWKLNGELEKLVNYKLKNGDKITEDDLNLFCEKSVEVKIFDFIDAIGERNKRKAIELLGFLLENKEDAFYVFSMVVYQLRNIAKVDYFKRKGVFDQAKIAKETGLHPYVVKKTFFGLKNFKTSEIKSIYEACYRLDFSVKTGKMEIRDALKDLIFKI